jgi:hypothetical protein
MNFNEQLNELIAQRALYLSEKKCSAAGDPLENWIEAEREIYNELNHRTDELHEKFDLHGEDPFH